ncbi:MAG: hypothetical protein ACE5H8_09140 [Alphaproteobacteria bacterium]
MSERPRRGPRLSEKGRQERADRRARLVEALRENLRRRKAQARGRAMETEPSGPDAGAPGAADEPGGEA